MTFFISLREQATAGSVVDAQVYEGSANVPELTWKSPTWLALQVKGKEEPVRAYVLYRVERRASSS